MALHLAPAGAAADLPHLLGSGQAVRAVPRRVPHPGGLRGLPWQRAGLSWCVIADEPRTAVERAESLSRVFALLLPVVLSIVGLGLVLAFVVVSPLRDPALIVPISGLYSAVGGIGLALSRKDSK